MPQPEKLDAFYRRKMGQVPEGYYHSVGHFNVFRLDPYVGRNAKSESCQQLIEFHLFRQRK